MPAAVAYDIDHCVLDPLLELDVAGFYSRIIERSASVCGYGPIAVRMQVCKELGANSARLLNYSNSGDVQPMPEVVGYAGVVVGLWWGSDREHLFKTMLNYGTTENFSEIAIFINFTAEHAENAEPSENQSEDWSGLKTLRSLR